MGRSAPLAVFAALTAFVFILHAPLLSTPLFWDEIGQFVPQALDILNRGTLIPQSTSPNVHPPGLMLYLAGVWRVTGYSIPTTRCAMLLLAGLALWATWLLARDLAPGARRWPPLLLMCSPVFFTQSMLAQLDMPALVFSTLALAMFFRGSVGGAALACAVLVSVKETGALLPLLLAGWLVAERRIKEAGLILLALAPLALWLGFLFGRTGFVLGDPAFAQYNLSFPLHPVRFVFALFRRVWYLSIGGFHWIGALVILAAILRANPFRRRPWAVVASFAALHTLTVSALGGATLERYLLPVLPILYSAVAAASAALMPRAAYIPTAPLAIGLLLALNINPPYPFPYENNLAFIRFTELHRQTARFLETELAGRTIATSWPLTDELRRPEGGYITRPFAVREVEGCPPAPFDVLVLYSKEWDPPLSLLRIPFFDRAFRRFYSYRPAVSGAVCQERLGYPPVREFRESGQWVQVYTGMPLTADSK